MLSMEAFINEMEKYLQEALEKHNRPDVSIQIQKVPKNNDVVKTGVWYVRSGSHINPVVYLEDFYAAFMRAVPVYANDSIVEREMKKIAEIIITKLSTTVVPDEKLVAGFWNKDFRERVCMKLVNHDMNRENLENVVHIDYLDLAVTFFYLLNKGKEGTQSITITKELLEHINPVVDEHKLFTWAIQNTRKLFPHELLSMQDVLTMVVKKALFGGAEFPLDEGNNMIDEERVSNLYILTNGMGQGGAAVILYPDLLSEIAKKLDDDLIIIPSSTEEVLICRKSCAPIDNELVRFVNKTEVESDNILSDHLYLYLRDKDVIEIMEDKDVESLGIQSH